MACLVKGVDKNEEGEFEYEAVCCNSVNMLGEASGKLTEGGFDAFTKMLNQKLLDWRVWPFTAALTGGLLLAASGFSKQVFQDVVSVGGIGVQRAALGQV